MGNSRSKGTCPRSEGDAQKGNVFIRVEYSVYNLKAVEVNRRWVWAILCQLSKEGETFGGFQQARNSQEWMSKYEGDRVWSWTDSWDAIYRVSYMWGSRGTSKKKGTGDMADTKEMGGELCWSSLHGFAPPLFELQRIICFTLTRVKHLGEADQGYSRVTEVDILRKNKIKHSLSQLSTYLWAKIKYLQVQGRCFPKLLHKAQLTRWPPPWPPRAQSTCNQELPQVWGQWRWWACAEREISFPQKQKCLSNAQFILVLNPQTIHTCYKELLESSDKWPCPVFFMALSKAAIKKVLTPEQQ